MKLAWTMIQFVTLCRAGSQTGAHVARKTGDEIRRQLEKGTASLFEDKQKFINLPEAKNRSLPANDAPAFNKQYPQSDYGLNGTNGGARANETVRQECRRIKRFYIWQLRRCAVQQKERATPSYRTYCGISPKWCLTPREFPARRRPVSWTHH